MTRTTQENTIARRGGRGMTLVEAVVACLIVATMLVAALGAMGSSAKAGTVQANRRMGACLARQLMAEILQARYREPVDTPAFGTESPESRTCRALWDDVDDYNGWIESPPQAKDGTSLGLAAGWRRDVTVAYVTPDDPTAKASGDQGLKRITVTVTDPAGKKTIVQALRAAGSIYDLQTDTQTTYLSAVNVEIRIGPLPDSRVVGGVNLLNLVPQP